MSKSLVSFDAQANAFYKSEMQRYRNQSQKVNDLRGRGVTHLSSKESRDKDWWNSCKIYTAIAVFAIIMLSCVVVAALAATGLLI
jgi:hypothetical protein